MLVGRCKDSMQGEQDGMSEQQKRRTRAAHSPWRWRYITARFGAAAKYAVSSATWPDTRSILVRSIKLPVEA